MTGMGKKTGMRNSQLDVHERDEGLCGVSVGHMEYVGYRISMRNMRDIMGYEKYAGV